jgi:preprotein translocase subunit SecD
LCIKKIIKEIPSDVIFNNNDVDEIWIDSSSIDGKNVYKVTGGFTPDAIIRLSAFTGQNIGKRSGFVLNGEIITSEVIEQKDDEGRFSIVFTKKSKAQRAYESLLIGK